MSRELSILHLKEIEGIMDWDVERKTNAILKVLSKYTEPLGASLISRELQRDHGINLSDRAIRYHLKIMDERGMTKGFGKSGRTITAKGREEIKNALVSDKVGMVITKIQSNAYLTELDPSVKKGRVVLNISLIDLEDLPKALKAMKPVFESGLGMSEYLVVAKEGEEIGDFTVPKGKAAIGTICSVTISGVLIKAGIPVDSLFAGILEIDEGKAKRFTEIIKYEGTSLDPLEIFLQSKMTSVSEVAETGKGKILASFREIPSVSLEKAVRIIEDLSLIGISGVIEIGEPNQPIANIPVGMDRVGLIVAGGLNPLAAVEESGIHTQSKAMSAMVDISKLKTYSEIL